MTMSHTAERTSPHDEDRAWPREVAGDQHTGFDVHRVETSEPFVLSAKLARRALDAAFDTIPAERSPSDLYGLLLRRTIASNNGNESKPMETHGTVVFDMNAAYQRATFFPTTVVGSARFGYLAQDSEPHVLTGDRVYFVGPGDDVRLFRMANDYRADTHSVTEQMIDTARKRFLPTSASTRANIAIKSVHSARR